MKKRVLSLLLCVCLVLGMLPSGIAFAVNGETAGELVVDEEGKADCPVCGPVTWTAISGNSAGTQNLATIQDGEHHHYYLSADINAKNIANQYLNLLGGSKLCLHLNGHTLTHGGYIYVGGGSLLNIMGAGNVTFTDTNTGTGYDAAGLYIANSTLNLYSGNYSVAENAITTGKPMICQTGTSTTTVKNAVVSGQTLIKQGTLTLDEAATFENIQVAAAGKLIVESTWTGAAQANFAVGLTDGAVPAANASAEMGFTGTLTMQDGTELLADENGTVLASSLNSSLYLNSDNKALCPVCKETVTWTPISSNASLGTINSGHHHRYLTKDIDARGIANQYLNLTSGAKLCLHLNGHDLTYGGYIFVASSSLNIMGSGNVTFTDTNTYGDGFDNAGLYLRNSTVNLYSGTYSVAENAITTGKPTIYQEIRNGTACTVNVKNATVNGLTDFASGTLTLDEAATFENIQVAAAGKLIVESTWTGDAQANFAAGLTNGAVPAANASAESGFTGTLTMPNGSELIAEDGLLKCSHNYGEGVVTPPTCEAGGYTTYTCKDCGHSYTDAETEATNHAWGDWEKISDTEHKRVCANDASHTETADHSYVAGEVVAPDFGVQGYTVYTCTGCGDSYKDNYKDALVAVAEIVNGDKFTTLDAALAAAKSGDTVKLLKDATITGDVTLAAGITYEIPADAVLTVAAGASATADVAATLNCYGTIVVAGTADISALVYGEGKTFGACGGKLTVTATGNVKMLASWEKIWTPANDATIHADMLKDCQTGAKISVGSQNWELKAEGWEHTNHVYTDVYNDPTFEADAYTVYTCTCGDTYTETHEGTKKIPAVEVNGTKYETIEEAMKAEGEVKLLKDHDIALTDNVTVDLNGYDLTAELNGNDITVKGEGTFAGSDVANDSYDASACGKITLLDGATIDVDNTVNGVRYIAVKNADETYSYHRLDVTVKHVTIRTTEAGLYYKSAFKADEVLLAAATKYGVVLSLSNMPGANWDEDGTDINVATEVDAAITPLAFDKVVTSGSVFGIMKSSRSAETNARYGKMYIYANPYLVVDGNVIMCDTENVGKTAEADGFNGVAYSLFSALKKVNDNWNNTDVVKEENKPAFKAYYDKWATIGMNLWADELPNISSYAAQ